jgi:hypothetical protein
MFVGTFALLAAIEVQNVLDFCLYVYPNYRDPASVWHGVSTESMDLCDVNSIPHEERLECIYTRGLVMELALWIFSRYELIPRAARRNRSRRKQGPLEDFYWPFVAHLAVSIEVYKERYPDSIVDARGCDLDMVVEQLKRCSEGRPDFEKAIANVARKKVKSILPPTFEFVIHTLEQPFAFPRRSIPLASWTTALLTLHTML